MKDITTQEFISARSKAILKQINDLRRELAVLRSLKNSLSGKPPLEKTIKNRLNVTFQDMIIEVLNDQVSKGAEALEIIDLIKKKHDKEILRSSISPQLSRLKAKGVLELDNGIWTLTDKYKAQKESGPQGPDNSGDMSLSLDLNNSGDPQTNELLEEMLR